MIALAPNENERYDLKLACPSSARIHGLYLGLRRLARGSNAFTAAKNVTLVRESHTLLRTTAIT
jgi:hypothetical protein